MVKVHIVMGENEGNIHDPIFEDKEVWVEGILRLQNPEKKENWKKEARRSACMWGRREKAAEGRSVNAIYEEQKNNNNVWKWIMDYPIMSKWLQSTR